MQQNRETPQSTPCNAFKQITAKKIQSSLRSRWHSSNQNPHVVDESLDQILIAVRLLVLRHQTLLANLRSIHLDFELMLLLG